MQKNACGLDKLIAYPGCIDWMPEHCYGFNKGLMRLGWNPEITDVVECYARAELNQECVERATAIGCDEAAYGSSLDQPAPPPPGAYDSLREYQAKLSDIENTAVKKTELEAELNCPEAGLSKSDLLDFETTWKGAKQIDAFVKLKMDFAVALAGIGGKNIYQLCEELVGKMLAMDARMTSAKVDCTTSSLGEHDPCHGDGTMDWDAMELVNEIKDSNIYRDITTVAAFVPFVMVARHVKGFLAASAEGVVNGAAKVGTACRLCDVGLSDWAALGKDGKDVMAVILKRGKKAFGKMRRPSAKFGGALDGEDGDRQETELETAKHLNGQVSAFVTESEYLTGLVSYNGDRVHPFYTPGTSMYT